MNNFNNLYENVMKLYENITTKKPNFDEIHGKKKNLKVKTSRLTLIIKNELEYLC